MPTSFLQELLSKLDDRDFRAAGPPSGGVGFPSAEQTPSRLATEARGHGETKDPKKSHESTKRPNIEFKGKNQEFFRVFRGVFKLSSPCLRVSVANCVGLHGDLEGRIGLRQSAAVVAAAGLDPLAALAIGGRLAVPLHD